MATSVKMREADKGRLDRLQAELTSRSGRKMTQEELLGRLVALGERERDRLAAPPLRGKAAEEVWARLRRLPVRTGIVTSWEEIDRHVYGEGA